jgi:hypothetical protein
MPQSSVRHQITTIQKQYTEKKKKYKEKKMLLSTIYN